MSISDIWGATDKHVDPDAINVPQDPAEAFRAGLRMGISQNIGYINKWLHNGGNVGFVCMELKCTPEELRKIIGCDVEYWMERTDTLAAIRINCKRSLEGKGEPCLP